MSIPFYGHATAAVFAPLESMSRSDLVARRLTDAIALGLLPDGEQLPGELDLAGLFRVSTVTIREALSSLRHQGLIVTRRGRGGGSFVRATRDVAVGLASERLASLSLVDVRDLGDVYAAVAGSCAALAARRSSPEDVDRLRRVAGQLASAPDAGARRRADAHFSIEVAVAAQSPRLYREEVDLQAEVGTLLWLALGDDDSHAEVVTSSQALVEAVAGRDAEAARSAAESRVADATVRLIDFKLNQEA
ncbi:MAG: FadR family transcriptional regulator [Nocardioidaceae bacterium]|nr:FadR family transcriptional regulator [Nocardioidaceae bacterium]